MTAQPCLKKSVRLHREASALANRARIAQFDGDEAEYLNLTHQAFRKESESAHLLREDPSHRMFAILHRSAATLAYRCGEYESAEDLVLHGLTQGTGSRLRNELYNLLDKVRLAQKYGTGADELEVEDLVMTLRGIEANRTLIEPTSLTRRINNFSTLVRNTIGSINQYSFRERGKVDRDYRVFATVPSLGSYRIGMTMTHLGPKRFTDLSYFDGVRHRFLENLRLLNSGDLEQLKNDIQDEGYFLNFVGLAKELAPDGKVITSVGIEAEIEGQRKSMLFDSTRDELTEMVLPLDEQPVSDEYRITDETDIVVGVLQCADATKDEVKLLTDNGKWWKIVVPEGLAEDVVKPYFGDRVRVQGRHIIKARKARRLYLRDIRSADESTNIVPQLQVPDRLLEA